MRRFQENRLNCTNARCPYVPTRPVGRVQGLDDDEVAWGDPEVENLAMLDRLETIGGRAAELAMRVRRLVRTTQSVTLIPH